MSSQQNDDDQQQSHSKGVDHSGPQPETVSTLELARRVQQSSSATDKFITGASDVAPKLTQEQLDAVRQYHAGQPVTLPKGPRPLTSFARAFLEKPPTSRPSAQASAYPQVSFSTREQTTSVEVPTKKVQYFYTDQHLDDDDPYPDETQQDDTEEGKEGESLDTEENTTYKLESKLPSDFKDIFNSMDTNEVNNVLSKFKSVSHNNKLIAGGEGSLDGVTLSQVEVLPDDPDPFDVVRLQNHSFDAEVSVLEFHDENVNFSIKMKSKFDDIMTVSSASTALQGTSDVIASFNKNLLEKIPHELVAYFMFGGKEEKIYTGPNTYVTPDGHKIVKINQQEIAYTCELKTANTEALFFSPSLAADGYTRYLNKLPNKYLHVSSGIGVTRKEVCFTNSVKPKIPKEEFCRRVLNLFCLGHLIKSAYEAKINPNKFPETIPFEKAKCTVKDHITRIDESTLEIAERAVAPNKVYKYIWTGLLKKEPKPTEKRKKEENKVHFSPMKQKRALTHHPMIWVQEGSLTELQGVSLPNLLGLREMVSNDFSREDGALPVRTFVDSVDINNPSHRNDLKKGAFRSLFIEKQQGAGMVKRTSNTSKSQTEIRDSLKEAEKKEQEEFDRQKRKFGVWDESLALEELKDREHKRFLESGLQTLEYHPSDYAHLLDSVGDHDYLDSIDISSEGCNGKTRYPHSDERWYKHVCILDQIFSITTQAMKVLNHVTFKSVPGLPVYIMCYSTNVVGPVFYKVLAKGKVEETITDHWVNIKDDWWFSKQFFSSNPTSSRQELVRTEKAVNIRSFLEDYFSDQGSAEGALSESESIFLFVFLCSLRMPKSLIDNLSLVRYMGMEATTYDPDPEKIFTKLNPCTRVTQQAWWNHLLLQSVENYKRNDVVNPITGTTIPFSRFIQIFYLHFIHLFPMADPTVSEIEIVHKTLAIDMKHEYDVDTHIEKGGTLETWKEVKASFQEKYTGGNPDLIGPNQFCVETVSSVGYIIGEQLLDEKDAILNEFVIELRKITWNMLTTAKRSMDVSRVEEYKNQQVAELIERVRSKYKKFKEAKDKLGSSEDSLSEEEVALLEKFMEDHDMNMREFDEWIEKESSLLVKKTYCICNFLKKKWTKSPAMMILELMADLKNYENVAGQFAKVQATGNREIFIITFEYRILILFSETFQKVISKRLPNETISDHNRKERIPKEQDKWKKEMKSQDYEVFELCNSCDATKFSQYLQYVMFTVFVGGLLKPFIEKEKAEEKAREESGETDPNSGDRLNMTAINNFLMTLFSHMSEKKIKIDDKMANYINRLNTKERNNLDTEYGRMRKSFETSEKLEDLKSFINPLNKKYNPVTKLYHLPTGMMQGIMQVLASVMHASFLLVMIQVIKDQLDQIKTSLSRKLDVDMKYRVVSACSSDDSVLRIAIAYKAIDKTTRNENLIRARKMLESYVNTCLINSERLKPLMGIKTSWEKSTISGTIAEFNSAWSIGSTPIHPLIKYSVAYLSGVSGNTAQERLTTLIASINESAAIGMSQKVLHTMLASGKRLIEKLALGRKYEALRTKLHESREMSLFWVPLLPEELCGLIPMQLLVYMFCSGKFGRIPILTKSSSVFESYFKMESAQLRMTFGEDYRRILRQLDVNSDDINEHLLQEEQLPELREMISGRAGNSVLQIKAKLCHGPMANSMSFKDPSKDNAARQFAFENVCLGPRSRERLESLGLTPTDVSESKGIIMSKVTREKFRREGRKVFIMEDILKALDAVDEVTRQEQVGKIPVNALDQVDSIKDFLIDCLETTHIPKVMKIQNLYVFPLRFPTDDYTFVKTMRNMFSKEHHSQASLDRFSELIKDTEGLKPTLRETLECGTFTPLQIINMCNQSPKPLVISYHSAHPCRDLPSLLKLNMVNNSNFHKSRVFKSDIVHIEERSTGDTHVNTSDISWRQDISSCLYYYCFTCGRISSTFKTICEELIKEKREDNYKNRRIVCLANKILGKSEDSRWELGSLQPLSYSKKEFLPSLCLHYKHGKTALQIGNTVYTDGTDHEWEQVFQGKFRFPVSGSQGSPQFTFSHKEFEAIVKSNVAILNVPINFRNSNFAVKVCSVSLSSSLSENVINRYIQSEKPARSNLRIVKQLSEDLRHDLKQLQFLYGGSQVNFLTKRFSDLTDFYLGSGYLETLEKENKVILSDQVGTFIAPEQISDRKARANKASSHSDPMTFDVSLGGINDILQAVQEYSQTKKVFEGIFNDERQEVMSLDVKFQDSFMDQIQDMSLEEEESPTCFGMYGVDDDSSNGDENNLPAETLSFEGKPADVVIHKVMNENAQREWQMDMLERYSIKNDPKPVDFKLIQTYNFQKTLEVFLNREHPEDERLAEDYRLPPNDHISKLSADRVFPFLNTREKPRYTLEKDKKFDYLSRSESRCFLKVGNSTAVVDNWEDAVTLISSLDYVKLDLSGSSSGVPLLSFFQGTEGKLNLKDFVSGKTSFLPSPIDTNLKVTDSSGKERPMTPEEYLYNVILNLSDSRYTDLVAAVKMVESEKGDSGCIHYFRFARNVIWLFFEGESLILKFRAMSDNATSENLMMKNTHNEFNIAKVKEALTTIASDLGDLKLPNS